LISNHHVLGFCDGNPNFESFELINFEGKSEIFLPGKFDYEMINTSLEENWDWILLKLNKKINWEIKSFVFADKKPKEGDKIYFAGIHSIIKI
jgi:hypothetical protein